MDKILDILLSQGGAFGLMAAIFLILFIREKKEHREDLLMLLPLATSLKDSVIPFVNRQTK